MLSPYWSKQGINKLEFYQTAILLDKSLFFVLLATMIKSGKLCPEKLIGKTISLDESSEELANMNNFSATGVTVINEF